MRGAARTQSVLDFDNLKKRYPGENPGYFYVIGNFIPYDIKTLSYTITSPTHCYACIGTRGCNWCAGEGAGDAQE